MVEGNDPEIVSVFFDETQSFLEALNEGLLRLESDLESVKQDKEQIDSLFRAYHSIKGASGMLGFDRVNRLTHRSENLLDGVRSGRIELNPELVQILFEGLDTLNALLNELKTNQQTVDLDPILARLDQALEGSLSKAVAPAQSSPAPVETPQAAETAQAAPAAQAEGPAPEMAKYVPAFLDEAQEATQAIESRLIEIESRVDRGDLSLSDDEINVLFRSAHQIKGSSAAIGFKRVSELTHGVEALLDGLRKKSMALSSDLVETLLVALANLKDMQQQIRDNGADGVDAREVQAKINSFLGAKPKLSLVENKPAQASAAPAAGRKNLEISFQISKQDPAPGVRAFLVANKAESVGTIVKSAPPVNQMAEASAGTVFQLTLATEKSEQEIVTLLTGEGAEDVKCSNPQQAQKKPAEEGATGPAKAVQTMRVDVERLDRLMNMSGEMVVNRARFVQIEAELREAIEQEGLQNKIQNMRGTLEAVLKEHSGAASERLKQMLKEMEEMDTAAARFDRAKSVYLSFQDAMQQSDLISSEIQKAIMDIRMVPIGPLFGRFKRVVRDIAKENGKDVDLVIRGEDTEIDKKLIDELADPLTHLVRNCVDHGVESPDDRVKKGKIARGTVTLNAFQKGNKICITISDDGKGIDCALIRKKAVEKGIHTEASAAALSEHDVIQLIFHPGFSTAAKITNISGRGVGMDIVKKKLEELRGSIEIQTVPGKGSEFVLLLPLTLAIQKSLICEVNSTVFALPLESVLEIVHAKDQKTYFVGKDEFILLRDKVVTVKTMNDFFDGNAFRGGLSSDKPQTLIVLFYKNFQTAVWVDRLVGQEDIVIRSFNRSLGEVAGLSGVTILGSGAVGLVLDAPGLLDPRTVETESQQRHEQPREVPYAA